jgi:hypothetical protein
MIRNLILPGFNPDPWAASLRIRLREKPALA